MVKFLIAGIAVLGLSACGGGDSQSNEANALAADNMGADANLMMDGNMTLDPNMAMNGAMDSNAAAAAGANGAVDSNTAAAMAKDARTNDPDTNLANGM